MTVKAMTPRLSADDILDRVLSETGLNDFGDTRFLRDYRHTINAINEELDLTEEGIANLGEMAERMMVNRLRMYRDITAHPEILEEVIVPPVVVTGFARSGTTKMQRLLSSGPAFQKLANWKVLNIAPFPSADASGEDPRIAWTENVMSLMQKAYPELVAQHPTPARDAEEDYPFHDMTFRSPTIPMRVGAHKLLAELNVIPDAIYDYVKTCLQYLQWQDKTPDGGRRPWVIKSPIHLGNIATLQRVFPGARIIHCHRDVEVCTASSARMDEIMRVTFTQGIDMKDLGNEILDYWSGEWDRNIAQRPKLEPGSFCDVHFEDINRNSVAIVRRIYGFLGMDFDQTAEDAVLHWEANNERHKFGRHEYDAADYGLTREKVHRAYQRYFDYFTEEKFLRL